MMAANASHHIEHRWRQRCPAQIPVTLRASGPEAFACMSENVSTDGIYLTFEGRRAELHPGSGVQLEFNLRLAAAEQLEQHTLVGVVAHCSGNGVGIMFANCTPPLFEFFESLLSDQQRSLNTPSGA